MMNYQDFFNQNNGKGDVGDTPENKGQCVGLIEVWTDNLELPHTWGNAKDLLNDADPAHFTIIKNTPQGVPEQGDIVVWSGAYNNGPGHTGICHGNANTDTFDCFEQNDPLNSPCHVKNYNYTSVLGWLKPSVKPTVEVFADKFNELVDKSTAVDSISQLLGISYTKDILVGKIKTMISYQSQLEDQNRQKDQSLADAKSQIADLEKQLGDLKTEHDQLISSHDQDTKTIAIQGEQLISLQKQIQSLKESVSVATMNGLQKILSGIKDVLQGR